ncbi:class I SAM-dependent methyltransferase [Rhodospirillum sp. A1_3_36]|uniref:class I SAM-dependent methyltransferase n=1 Tax=Rhodospirillum sp. A1_3_36 TaxID=3391666 RepID=UPI0039A673FA
MVSDPRYRTFLETNTAEARPPLVPEIRLRLATEITPLWQATEIVLEKEGVPPPFWAFCWAGGQALARHVLDHPETVRGRRVLDFAAGCGVCGIAAALAGAKAVEGNEIDPVAMEAMSMNAALNGVDLLPQEGDVVGSLDRVWDVVLAGDVCYEKPLAERVIPWMRALAARGTRVLIADPGRSYLPSQGLSALATYSVPVSRELEDRDIRETTVYALLP